MGKYDFKWEYDENWELITDSDGDSWTVVKDANWNQLINWDSVQAIKDLKVKWWSGWIKRWDIFKKIRLTDNEEEIECGSWKSTLVLKTCFFKKV